MATSKTRWLLSISAGLSMLTLASLSPDTASASDCSVQTAAHAGDTLSAEGYRILGTKDLYRVQDRPYTHIPTGTKLLISAPEGSTEADLHRAALCQTAAHSPLSVPGAKLMVRRAGHHYELLITAPERSAAREIQRRAKSL